jgi:NTE family protein
MNIRGLYPLICILLMTGMSLAFRPGTAFAQKVGLVLSGGGAKGAAHIGVIKALEESGIPIHFITGTSMGAVIGGLYASGYSPQQIDSMMFTAEFMNAIEGVLDERYYYHFMKAPPDASWIKLRFSVDSTFKSKIPSGFVSTDQLDYLMMEHFGPASAVAHYDFDSLFVPFRCVAADIENNAQVVLDSGDLGAAVRASMSFPFYFKPIRHNGQVLMDGGLYNNFPSDVMYEQFFPDIIIGSKAASNYKPPDEEDIISQLQTMLMESTNYTVICEDGILIEPELPRINIFDYSMTRDIIDSGYNATLRKISLIREFVRDSIPASQMASRRSAFNNNKIPLVFNRINIQGVNRNQASYIKKSLPLETRSLKNADLRTEYHKLLADDKISTIIPRALLPDTSRNYCLCMNVTRDKDFLVSLGGNVSSNPGNSGFIELRYNYLGKTAASFSANTYVGRFYNSLKLSTRLDIPGINPFYLDVSGSLNQWDYFETSTYFFEDKQPSYLIENENNILVGLGFPAMQHGKIELGYAAAMQKYDYYQTNYFTREDTADRTYFDMNALSLIIEFSTLNRIQYPTKGILVRTKVALTDGMEENIPGSTSTMKDKFSTYHQWFSFDFLYDYYADAVGFYTAGFLTELYISSQSLFNNYSSSLIASPAFQPVPESKTLFLPQYRTYNYAALGLKNLFHISKNIHFRLEGYVFQPFQEITENNDYSAGFGDAFENRYFLASGAAVYNSPLGPVSLSLNYYEGNDDPWSLVFNFGYVVFNRKARD